jgi:HD superfamily phosphodiesterase
MQIDREEVASLTHEYGGQWGISHTRRLLQLISIIGEGLSYNSEALWLAAHLHDWGGYSKWAQKDVDHAARSTEVADAFLTEHGCDPGLQKLVLECIRLHHSGGPDRSLESRLLSDADALDFLGVVGVLRDFSKNPKDMRKAYDTTRTRRAKLPDTLSLARSKELATDRIRQMDELLQSFEDQSWGYF